jgi:hypothetical protein
VPREILTDNGKVFTGRFGPGTGEVLFDRICRENGIKHILTAPRSPTTTGKVERWHKTLRREFLNGKVFNDIADAQAQLDAWVHEYNHERRHQGIGDVVPWERFRLAVSEPADPVELTEEPTTTRRVGKEGKISFAAPIRTGCWCPIGHPSFRGTTVLALRTSPDASFHSLAAAIAVAVAARPVAGS